MQSPPGQNAHLERRELPEENPCPVGRSMLEYYNSRTPFPWLNLQPPAVWAGQSSPSNTAWAIICLTRWTRTHRPTVCVHWHKTPGLSSIASGARVSFQDKPTRQHRTQKGQAHTQEEAFSTTQLEVEWLHMLLIHRGVSQCRKPIHLKSRPQKVPGAVHSGGRSLSWTKGCHCNDHNVPSMRQG